MRELAALTLHSPVATRSLSGVVAAACPPRTQRASAPRRVHCSVTAECAARTRRMRVYRLLSRCGGGTTWMSHRSQLLLSAATPEPTTPRSLSMAAAHQRRFSPSIPCGVRSAAADDDSWYASAELRLQRNYEHVGDAEAVRSHARPLAGIRGLGIVLPIILRRAAPRRAAFNQTNGRHG